MERWRTAATLDDIRVLSHMGDVIVSKNGVSGFPEGEVKVRVKHLDHLDEGSVARTKIEALLREHGQVYADVL